MSDMIGTADELHYHLDQALADIKDLELRAVLVEGAVQVLDRAEPDKPDAEWLGLEPDLIDPLSYYAYRDADRKIFQALGKVAWAALVAKLSGGMTVKTATKQVWGLCKTLAKLRRERVAIDPMQAAVLKGMSQEQPRSVPQIVEAIDRVFVFTAEETLAELNTLASFKRPDGDSFPLVKQTADGWLALV